MENQGGRIKLIFKIVESVMDSSVSKNWCEGKKVREREEAGWEKRGSPDWNCFISYVATFFIINYY